MNVLHFLYTTDVWNVRLQRMVQADTAIGNKPTIYTNSNSLTNNCWTPNTPVYTYTKNRALAYMLPAPVDHVGLKKVFNKTESDVVHAHNLPCAYYSYNLGLPTVYDDWEYNLEYYKYTPQSIINKASIPLRLYRQNLAKYATQQLITNVPTIVTNKNVQTKYLQLGAKNVQVIPNVPNKKEVETALSGKWTKNATTSTCYVGAMTTDNKTVLRNTKGLQETWQKNRLGNLIIFENERYIPHLKLFETIRKCHYNLLYWNPLPVHRYYLQNKAFLASVVGVPTIISNSLTATIDLLGEYAIPVQTLEDIKQVITSRVTKDYSYPKKEHQLETYHNKLEKIYNN